MDRPTARKVTLAAHAAFVPTGIITVLLGPLLPMLSARWGLNDSQAGALFTAQFSGALLGTLLSGGLSSRFGFRVPMAAGLLMMALGGGFLLAGGWFVGMACVAAYGFGFGVTVPAANLSVAEANPEHRGASLSLLNFSWSVGAVACPFLLAAFARRGHTQMFLYLTAAAALLIALAISQMPYPSVVRQLRRRKLGLRDLTGNRFVVMLAMLFFLYVGIENAAGGWVASYAHRVGEGTGTMWLLTPSFYYGALLLGRGLAPVVLRRLPELTLARASLATASLGVVGLLTAHTVFVIFVFAAITGLGLAAVYPITIAMLSHKMGARSNQVGSAMFAVSNFGGASLPWLVGFCSLQFASLKAGLSVVLVAALLMLMLYSMDWQLTQPQSGDPT
jgi:fucose permease